MPTVSQSDVQDHLQRFQGRFTASLSDALEPLLTHRDPRLRRAALELQVRLASAALDIAIGPEADASLLDMVTLVELAKGTVADHWIPQVFHGQQAGPLGEAMERCSQDVWRVARKVLSAAEETQLRRMIAQWKASHPDQQQIAGMRFADFASPGEAGFGTIAREASGLFSGVRKAVQTADQTRLLAERALYAAQRLPFLLRMQVRLASQQLLGDLRNDLRPTLAAARRLGRTLLLASGLIAIGWVIVRLAGRR
jgi:hypothetical protein